MVTLIYLSKDSSECHKLCMWVRFFCKAREILVVYDANWTNVKKIILHTKSYLSLVNGVKLYSS